MFHLYWFLFVIQPLKPSSALLFNAIALTFCFCSYSEMTSILMRYVFQFEVVVEQNINQIQIIDLTFSLLTFLKQRREMKWYIMTLTKVWKPCLKKRIWQHLHTCKKRSCKNCNRKFASWKQGVDVFQPRKPTSEIKRYY